MSAQSAIIRGWVKILSVFCVSGISPITTADAVENMKNFSDMMNMSISELANNCGCGEATIVRFSRRLGLSGYQELKLKIAQESANTAAGGVMGIEQDDTCYEIFKKRISDIHIALENTKSVLNPEEFEKAAKCRDTIASLKKLGERQTAVSSPDTECDVFGFCPANSTESGHDSISVFYIIIAKTDSIVRCCTCHNRVCANGCGVICYFLHFCCSV